MIDRVGRQWQFRIAYTGAQGAGGVERAEHSSEFGDAVWDALKPEHPDAPKRLGKIVTEMGAIPVIGEPTMEQVGFEAEFYGDG
ncbi:hypothetical protein RSD66_04235 [Brevundimonas sp. S1H14]|uniref:hypothetical protein n=1 Tax=Brevundimonas sp. S1H14 TaxID=3078084 RepID=UPI0039EB24C0